MAAPPPNRYNALRLSRPVATLVLLSLLTFFLGLGRPAIGDTDEGFYAEASREMVQSGDWLTPHYNFTDRWQKPILYYWLTAATYLITGPTEWSARAWSALSGLGLVLLTFFASRRMTSREDTAFLAGAIVATCYGYFFMARQALPDLPLAFFITLTIWSVLEHRWRLAAVAAALGFLMKGPVALVLPAIVLVPIWWHERTWPRASDLAWSACIFLVIGMPWYVAMALQHGSPYLQSFFVGDNLERFATTRFNGPRFVLYYVPIVVGGLMPWAMYLLVLPWRRARAVISRREPLMPHEWRLAAWTLAPLLFYTVSVGKQPRYILPVLPPLAMLLAQSIASRVRTPAGATTDRSRGLAMATWLTAALLLAIAGLLTRARPLFISAYPALTIIGLVAIVVSALALGAIAFTRAWTRLPAALTTMAAVALLTAQFGAFAGRRPEAVEQMNALIQAHRTSEEVGEYQVFVRNLVFYARHPQIDLPTDEAAVSFMQAPRRALLVVRAEDAQRIEQAAGMTFRRLGEVRYVDTANIKLRTVLWPDADRDVDRVLLLANQ
jgi:4-amino-4-deoxy-L-arabinose transferase-like glycosyltransferase